MPDKFFKIILVVGILILPAISFAQFNFNVDMPYALTNELNVEVVPTYPKPNEQVWMYLTMYTEDLNSSDITWYKDGKNVLSGKGEVKYSFQTGSVGEETKIEIKIKLLNGTSFSKSFTLNPAGVDIVWEANSYVPPFYKGKALHPRQGSLKMVAMPEFVINGKRIAPEKLIYKWSNGVNVYESQSGYGKNVVTLNGSLLGGQENIEVLVTDPVNNLVAQSFVDIDPVDPEIVFYENNPYYGHIFDLAIASSFDLKTDEVQVLAAPFYFTKESYGLLQYVWRLNNQSIPDLSESRTAIFRKPEGESGSSVISLRMENSNRILQQAESNLTMSFKD